MSKREGGVLLLLLVYWGETEHGGIQSHTELDGGCKWPPITNRATSWGQALQADTRTSLACQILALLVSETHPGLAPGLSFGRGCNETSIGKVCAAIPSCTPSWGGVSVSSIIQSLSVRRLADVLISMFWAFSCPAPLKGMAWRSGTGDGHIIKTLPSSRVTNHPGSLETVQF